MLKIKRVFIAKGEIAEAMEYYENDRLKYYIYSYKIKNGKRWYPLVRWDNIGGIEHMDIYNENGNFVEDKEFPKRKFEDILRLIKTFRKSIIAMDISNI